MLCPMKNIMFGFVLLLALFIFGFTPGIIGNAQASPLFAQTPQPSATPQPIKIPTPPTPVTPPAKKPTAQPTKAPVAAKANPPKEQSSGPYDMEAIKAFNRALYGS
jgi:hypothetical protein